jgi:nucleoid-associated protein YgaU
MAEQKSIVEKIADLFNAKPSTQTATSYATSSIQKVTVAIPRTTARKIIATYKVRDTDTLSGIALKFYGSAIRDYWMVIYENNKAVIGNNPGVIHPGTELNIPELPGALPMKRRG